VCLGENDRSLPFKVSKLQVYQGMQLKDAAEVQAGDIVVLAGIDEVKIGDTICNLQAPLALPRIMGFLLVFIAVGAIASANLASLFGAELGGVAAVLDRFGPPLGTAVFAALEPWTGEARGAAGALDVTLRLLLWAGGGVALLIFCFRRVEI